MRKVLLCLLPVLSLTSVASADTLEVSRARKDVYVSADGSTAVATEGCTQSADAQTARFETYRGKPFLVFFDRSGEEEGDCQVKVVVRKVRKASPAKVARR